MKGGDKESNAEKKEVCKIKSLLRAIVDVILHRIAEILIPSADLSFMLKLLGFMLILRICTQALGCMSVIILVVLFLFS